MNSLDHLLNEELRRALDRISANVGEGTVGFVAAHHPGMRARLDEAEARLAAIRAELLHRFSLWRKTLEEIEALWELAGWEASQPGADQAFREAA